MNGLYVRNNRACQLKSRQQYVLPCNKIERFFGRLKASFCRIATRYEHTSANYLAMIKLASVQLWFEFYEYAT